MPRAALPIALAEDFEAALRELQAQMQQALDELRERAPAAFAQLEAQVRQAMQAQAQPAMPDTPAAVPPMPPLVQALEAFVSARLWMDSYRQVQAHPELLSDEALDILDRAISAARAAGNTAAVAVYEEHRALLRRCRELGTREAFTEKLGVPVEQLEGLDAFANLPPEVLEVMRELAREGPISSPEELERRLAATLCAGAEATGGDRESRYTRYTDISCPQRAQLNERIAVTVGLTLEASRHSLVAQPLDLGPEPVQVRLTAPRMALLGPGEQSVPILPDADSPPVVFYLLPQALGPAEITLEFRQQGQLVAPPVTFRVEVMAHEVAFAAAPYPPTVVDPALARAVKAPDLTLRVYYDPRASRLLFALWREGVAIHEEPAEAFAGAGPAAYIEGLYRDLALLRQGRDSVRAGGRGGRMLSREGQQRPAFVFNACHVAREGPALSGLDGWATQLVGRGAGLFLAPIWTVTDEKAARFAQTFYEHFFDHGQSAAAAVWAARQAIKEAGDPTWLAYSLYAHPNVRVTVAAAGA